MKKLWSKSKSLMLLGAILTVVLLPGTSFSKTFNIVITGTGSGNVYIERTPDNSTTPNLTKDYTSTDSFDLSNKDKIKITITPSSLSKIDTYSIKESSELDSGSNVSSEVTYTIDSASNTDHTLSVEFAPLPTYTITATVTSTGGGTISPSGDVSVVSGSNQEFTFNPDSGYKIASLYVDDTIQTDTPTSYTFENVTENHTIEVNFSSTTTPQYTITPTATPSSGGTISPSSAVTVNQGDDQTFTFSPTTDPLYYISDVKVDGASIGSTPTSYEFISIDQNHTIEVVFASDDVNTYTVTPSVNDENMGSIDPSENFTVNEGEDITFEITPYPGHIISDILINNTSTDQTVQSPFTISNVTENMEVQAVFAEDSSTFDITVTVNDNSFGSISPSETPLTVLINDTPSFTISPASKSYAISDVTVGGVSQGAISSYTFPPVTADTSIHATFVTQNTYTISSTLSPTNAGSISPSTPYTAAENETPSFIISANTGYQIKSVTTSSGTTTVGAGYYNLKLPAVISDQSITVEFETATDGGDSGGDDTSSGCLPIDDVPVEVQTQGVPANIMFLIEDANTMDFEVSTLEDNMLFYDRAYLYGMPADYTGGTSDSDNTMAYGQNKTLYIGNNDNSDPTRLAWKAYWHEFNRMYYNPAIKYQPWPTPSGTMSPADIDNPYTHPIDLEYQIDLDMTYGTVGSVTIPVSHYYVKGSDDNIYLISIKKDAPYSYEYYRIDGADATTNLLGNKEEHQTIDNLTITPLTSFPSALTQHWDDPEKERQNFANWFTYHRKRYLTSIYAIAKTMKNITGVNVGFTATVPAQESSFTKPGGATPEEYLTLGTADFIQPVLSIDTHLNELMWRLYEYRVGNTSSSSFIRRALEEIGLYYEVDTDTNFGDSPIEYTCQQNFTIVFNDGAYHGGAPNNGTDWDSSTPSGTGYHATTDVNGTTVTLTNVPPFSDTAGTSTKTMADMAMWFYIKDLAPALADEVPTMEMSTSNSKTLTSGKTVTTTDVANWQHMVTYSVVFGDHGAHDPAAFDITDESTYPSWPKGISNSSTDPEIVDDIWHAALNGRGRFFAASNPDELEKALQDLISDIKSRIGASGSAVSVSGDQLETGSFIFQTKYNTNGWSGDVIAYDYCEFTDDGCVDQNYVAKRASQQIESQFLDANNADTGYNFSTRKIFTNDGSSIIPFSGSQTDLDSTLTSDIVDYIRGEKTNEEQFGGTLRNRLTVDDEKFTLGDIVHSSPAFYNNVLYVGANDGMLHALRAKDSASDAGDQLEEIFAYIPSFVHGHLAELADTGYGHKYYVDQTPYIAETNDRDLLVGGLGKGGKGVYGINVSGIDNTTASADVNLTASGKVWEFPLDSGDDPLDSGDDGGDMGYSFSRVWVVKSHHNETLDENGIPQKDGDWVVIFGNGYDSTKGHAILYILDTNGALLKKIDTGENYAEDSEERTCNGLSSPAPVDINNDGIMDYIYAGDLKGNLWKFDVTSRDGEDWRVYYSDELGKPQPLFRSGKPITTMPDVINHCSYHGSIVVFGTGKLLSIDDVSTSGHSVYGIWDFGFEEQDPSEYLGALTTDGTALTNLPGLNVTLKELTVEQEGDYRVVGRTDDPPNWNPVDDAVSTAVKQGDAAFNQLTANEDDATGHTFYDNPEGSDGDPADAGWFFNLTDTNERVALDIRIRSGLAYIVSAAPTEMGECSAFSGTSWVMAVNACTGGIPPDAVWDTDDSNVLDKDDTITMTAFEQGASPVYATGIKKPLVAGLTLVSDKAILSYDDAASGGTGGPGGIDILDTLFFSAGFLYWQQVD